MSIDRPAIRLIDESDVEAVGVQRTTLDNERKEKTMRFLVMVRATRDSEAGVMPDEKLIGDMTKFNEELVKAGVLLAGEGLHPSARGVRVKFSGNKRTVVDGP